MAVVIVITTKSAEMLKCMCTHRQHGSAQTVVILNIFQLLVSSIDFELCYKIK